MKYSDSKRSPYSYFVWRPGAVRGPGPVRRARRHRLCPAELPVRAPALQHPADDPHQRADRLAAARLLRRHLLPAARGGRARDPQPAARLHPVRLFLVGGRRRRGRLPVPIHEGREFLEQPLSIKSASSSRPDLPLQHQHDGAEGAQDGGHQRAAPRPVGCRRLLPVRLLQPVATSPSTRCTGGTSSTSGSRACGS